MAALHVHVLAAESERCLFPAWLLALSLQFGNRILVMHENEDMSLYDHWEVSVTEMSGA